MKNIFKDRRFKHGSLATVMTIGMVAVVVLVNIIFGMLADRFPMDVDLTSDKIFEVSDQTVNYLKDLKQKVTVTVLAKEDEFSGNNTYYNQANEVIQKYAKYSSNITIEYLDLYSNPEIAQKYPKETLYTGYIIVACGDRYQVLTAYDLFNTKTDSSSGSTYITSSRAEEAMTSAIMNVTNANPPTVAVLTGYGVSDVSAYTSTLETNGYVVNEVDLLTGEIGEDVDLVILAAPQTDLSDEVLKKLDTYLDNNGRFGKNLLYFASATQPQLPNLEEFLAEWGIVVNDGYVVETDSSKTYVMGPTYTIQQYEDEAYTEKLSSTDYPVLMVLAKTFSNAFGESGSASNRITSVLLKTYDSAALVPSSAASDDSWSLTDAEKGSYTTAMVGSRLKYDGTTPLTSRVIAFGSVESVANAFLTYTAVNNGDYMVNVANTVCGKDDGISIVSKTVGAKNLGITEKQSTVIGGFFQFVIPILVLIVGAVIWLRRRNR